MRNKTNKIRRVNKIDENNKVGRYGRNKMVRRNKPDGRK